MNYNDNNKSENEIRRNTSDETFNVSNWGTRHSQCILLFVIFTIAYTMRACFGMALVGMVNHLPKQNYSTRISNGTDNFNFTIDEIDENTNFTEVNRFLIERVNTRNESYNDTARTFFNTILLAPPFPRFDWSKKIQDTVISSFFWGYIVLQIPAGMLAHRFGARYLLVGAMAVNCLFSLLMPLAAYYGGWVCAAVCRIIQGLSQACIVPSIHTILGKWSPLEERGRMSGVIYGGQALGTMLGLPITGFLAASSWGWPGIFHFYGILSGLSAISLWFFLADSPAEHKNISASEKNYIEEALCQTGPKKKLPVPWKRMLLSPGMIAIIVGHISHTWENVTLYSELPSYMHNVIGVNMKANGLLISLPYLCMWLANFFFSWLTDMIIVKKYLNVTQTRKLLNTIGSTIPAIGLMVLGYSSNIYIVESILVIICTFKIALHFGCYVNHVDISPNYAGTMMSISNFCANAMSSQAPLVAGAILTDVTDVTRWRIVFSLSGGIYFLANVVYVIWGTGEMADWNEPSRYEEVASAHYEDSKEDKTDNEERIPLHRLS